MQGDRPDALHLANQRKMVRAPNIVAQGATLSTGATAASVGNANSRDLRAAPPAETQPVEPGLVPDPEPLLPQSALVSRPRS